MVREWVFCEDEDVGLREAVFAEGFLYAIESLREATSNKLVASGEEAIAFLEEKYEYL